MWCYINKIELTVCTNIAILSVRSFTVCDFELGMDVGARQAAHQNDLLAAALLYS